MNKTPLFTAIFFGSAAIAALGGTSMGQAQESVAADSPIESTAPGPVESTSSESIFEGIPEVEPAPEVESDSSIFFPEASTSTEKSVPELVEVPDKKDLKNKSEKKLAKAINTFEEFVSDPEINIPPDLLQQSEGIIIIPDMFQAGFFFGGRRGTGVMSLRNDDGSWSNPAFIKMTGGSLGLQIGAKSSDLVLIFPKREMVHEAFTGSYSLGGNVSGTAGSIGRNPVDSTSEYNKEKIYAYTRSSGLYGGVSLEGSELSFNSKRNREFYGRSLTPRQIFANASTYTEIPRIADSLSTLLSQAESGEFRLF